MLVFSTEKFIEAEGEKTYQSCKKWVDEIEGSEVYFPKGSSKGYSARTYYHIDRNWTVDENDYKPYKPTKNKK